MMDENPTPQSNDSPNEDLQARIRQASDSIAEESLTPPTPVKDTEPDATPAPEPVPEETPAESEPETQPEATVAAPPVEPEAPEQQEPEEEEFAPIPAQAPPPQLDAQRFVDDNGYVDVNKLTQSINETLTNAQANARATAQAEVAAQRAEERAWTQATEKYPQLKTDRTLRDIVQNARIGRTTELYQRAGAIADPVQRQQALSQIKIPTPNQIAQELFKRMGDAKSEGVRSATEQTKIAEQAFVDTSSTAEPAPSKTDELWGKISDARDPIGAREAQIELLKHKLFDE